MLVINPNPTAWTVNQIAGTSVSNSVYTSGATVGGYVTTASNGISTAVDAAMTINQGKMTITVPLEINGIDVEQVLKDLMNLTGVVARNKRLEAKYKGLKESGERYQSLLQKVQNDVNIKVKEASAEYRRAEEKYKTFETIKDSK
jgi:hypothetical protein